MDARNFLEVTNFKIKEGSYTFEDVKFMTATQKQKIYKGFVAFLNNHFKHTAFTKNIYEHCHCHCGFIAHYNINGFYGEYFSSAAVLHKIAFDVEKKPSEYDGFYVGRLPFSGKESIQAKHAFYQIYEELISKRNGLGEFYSSFSGEGGYFGASMHGDYGDLNSAIRDAFKAYLFEWEKIIAQAIQDFETFSNDEESKQLQAKKEDALVKAKALQEEALRLEEQLIHKQQFPKRKELKQSTMFDFINEVA